MQRNLRKCICHIRVILRKLQIYFEMCGAAYGAHLGVGAYVSYQRWAPTEPSGGNGKLHVKTAYQRWAPKVPSLYSVRLLAISNIQTTVLKPQHLSRPPNAINSTMP